MNSEMFLFMRCCILAYFISKVSIILSIVSDDNDNPPQICCFPFITSANSDAPIGTSVFRFNATDADAPPYGRLSFYLQIYWVNICK